MPSVASQRLAPVRPLALIVLALLAAPIARPVAAQCAYPTPVTASDLRGRQDVQRADRRRFAAGLGRRPGRLRGLPHGQRAGRGPRAVELHQELLRRHGGGGARGRADLLVGREAGRHDPRVAGRCAEVAGHAAAAAVAAERDPGGDGRRRHADLCPVADDPGAARPGHLLGVRLGAVPGLRRVHASQAGAELRRPAGLPAGADLHPDRRAVRGLDARHRRHAAPSLGLAVGAAPVDQVRRAGAARRLSGLPRASRSSRRSCSTRPTTARRSSPTTG